MSVCRRLRCGLLTLALWGTSAAAAESPWLLAPIVSSDPKVGTSGGVLGGYLHRFDQDSPTSTFGLAGSYSSTDSYVAGLFGQSYFGSDRHRLSGGIATGKIRNDYDDFLGSGLAVQTTDDLRFAAARYLYRLRGDWFVGAQFAVTNYLISGDNWFSEQILDLLSLTGFDSNALGLVAEYDSRNHQNDPSAGARFVIHNLAYRKGLGGDDDFDTLGFEYQRYLAHGDGHVLAWRVMGRVTWDAPRGAYSSVPLRGYVRGSFLAKHMATAELEERYRLSRRWALAGFAGAACLLGELEDCRDGESWFPMVGGGVIFTLKPAEKLVVRMDYAWGKSGNHGFYMSFGHPF